MSGTFYGIDLVYSGTYRYKDHIGESVYYIWGGGSRLCHQTISGGSCTYSSQAQVTDTDYSISIKGTERVINYSVNPEKICSIKDDTYPTDGLGDDNYYYKKVN